MRKDGTRFWADVVISAIRDERGDLRGYVKVTRDLTDRRNAEERLRASEERLRLMIESVKEYAIFMLTPDGHVATWNPGAEQLKGYSAAEIIGQHFSRFYPPRRTWPRASRRWSCRSPPRRGSSRRRASACARTARASGPAWS